VVTPMVDDIGNLMVVTPNLMVVTPMVDDIGNLMVVTPMVDDIGNLMVVTTMSHLQRVSDTRLPPKVKAQRLLQAVCSILPWLKK